MLDDQVLTSFKSKAAQAGRSLSSLVEEAMRVFDRRDEATPRPERWSLPVGSAGAYIGQADPLSNAEMLDQSEKRYGDVER